MVGANSHPCLDVERFAPLAGRAVVREYQEIRLCDFERWDREARCGTSAVGTVRDGGPPQGRGFSGKAILSLAGALGCNLGVEVALSATDCRWIRLPFDRWGAVRGGMVANGRLRSQDARWPAMRLVCGAEISSQAASYRAPITIEPGERRRQLQT